MLLVFLILCIIVFFGTGPWYSYSTNWGYYPSGFVLIMVIILLYFVLAGRGI